MQLRRLLLDKSHDIAGAQACESYRTGSKAIGEEPANE